MLACFIRKIAQKKETAPSIFTNIIWIGSKDQKLSANQKSLCMMLRKSIKNILVIGIVRTQVTNKSYHALVFINFIKVIWFIDFF